MVLRWSKTLEILHKWGACHKGLSECWLVLPGVRACSPVEKGILCMADPNSQEKLFSLAESGAVVPLLTSGNARLPSLVDFHRKLHKV